MNGKDKQEMKNGSCVNSSEVAEIYKAIYSTSKDRFTIFTTIISMFFLLIGYFGYDSIKEIRTELDHIKSIRVEAEETAREIDKLYNEMIEKIESKGIENATEEEKIQIRTLYKLKKIKTPVFSADRKSIRNIIEGKDE